MGLEKIRCSAKAALRQYLLFLWVNTDYFYLIKKTKIMIWIFLLYVLPLIISIVGAYFMVKQDEGDVKEFLQIVPLLFIPIFNIIAILVVVCILTQDWLDNNDDWQNFLNKKL